MYFEAIKNKYIIAGSLKKKNIYIYPVLIIAL